MRLLRDFRPSTLMEGVRVGEGSTDGNFATRRAAERQTTGAHVGAVEHGLAALGERIDEADGGFEEAGNVERHLNRDTGLNGGDAGTIFEIGYAVAKEKPVVALAQNVRPEDLKMSEGSGCVIADDFVTAIYQSVWALP